jgi:hypothetical protein
MKFLAGLVTGALLGALGVAAWLLLGAREPCAGACTGALACVDGVCVAAAPPGSAAPDPRPKPRKPTGPAGPGLEPLVPADDTLQTVGDVGPDEPRFIDVEGHAPDALPDGKIESAVSSISTRIVNCIAAAETRVDGLAPGTVTVAFRIRASGEVGGVKVTAAASLQKAGVTRCITAAVKTLHFPASAGTVVTYPFTHR